MKNFFFLVIISLLAGVTYGQTILYLPKYTAEKEYMDSISVNIEAGVDGVTFGVLHPQYDSVFNSFENLQEHITTQNNLGATSSKRSIVHAEAWFIKSNGILKNDGLIQQSTQHPSSPLSDVDFRSKQCGNYADKTIARAQAQNIALGNDSIYFRRWSLYPNGHELFEYYDDSLTQWCIVDADPGTPVIEPRNNNQPLSMAHLLSGVPMDSTSIFRVNALSPIPERALADYSNFLVPLLGGTVTMNEPVYVADHRERIYYHLPPNSSLDLGVRFKSLFINPEDVGGYEVIDSCAQFAANGDTLGLFGCFEEISNVVNITAQEALNAQMAGDVRLTQEPSGIGFDKAGWYITLILPPGSYGASDIHFDHPIRSIVVLGGSSVFYNDSVYTVPIYNRIYWPSGTSAAGNPPPIDPETIQYGVDTLYSVDTIIIQFYVNHKFWEFWEDEYRLLITQGSVEINKSWTDSVTTFIGDDFVLNNRIEAYPNPTERMVYFSKPLYKNVAVFNNIGQLVDLIPQGSLTYDFSNQPSGILFLKGLDLKIIKE